MRLHELIDREEPKCLYCKGDVDLTLDGNGIGLASFEVQILICRVCKERFEIHSATNSSYETEIVSFTFSCKKLAVIHNYDYGYLIGNHNLLWPNATNYQRETVTWIIPFEIDFSDKKKLHKKLKTYLVFS